MEKINSITSTKGLHSSSLKIDILEVFCTFFSLKDKLARLTELCSIATQLETPSLTFYRPIAFTRLCLASYCIEKMKEKENSSQLC